MADQRECITIDEVRNRLATVAGEIRSLGIRRLAVFGSVARGDAGPTSDVDLLVEFEPGRKGLVPFLDLADLLEAAIGRSVDLVTLQSLSPHMGPGILSEARDVLRAA
jgi:hypothetical protein